MKALVIMQGSYPDRQVPVAVVLIPGKDMATAVHRAQEWEQATAEQVLNASGGMARATFTRYRVDVQPDGATVFRDLLAFLKDYGKELASRGLLPTPELIDLIKGDIVPKIGEQMRKQASLEMDGALG